LLAHGRWFSAGTPASSTTKTGRHDIAEILLKVALSTIKSINRSNKLTIISRRLLSPPPPKKKTQQQTNKQKQSKKLKRNEPVVLKIRLKQQNHGSVF